MRSRQCATRSSRDSAVPSRCTGSRGCSGSTEDEYTRVFHDGCGIPELANVAEHQVFDLTAEKKPSPGRRNKRRHLSAVKAISLLARKIGLAAVGIFSLLLEFQKIEHSNGPCYVARQKGLDLFGRWAQCVLNIHVLYPL